LQITSGKLRYGRNQQAIDPLPMIFRAHHDVSNLDLRLVAALFSQGFVHKIICLV
jgi:hypothetical protein